MTKAWLEQLEGWHDFYVIVGSAAAGLTGLMFVVVSLGPKVISGRGSSGVRGFVTPTVVFFTTVLVMSAVMAIPALSLKMLRAILCAGGLGALIYLVWIRSHKQWRESQLDRLDWCWYIGLPFLSYLSIVANAIVMGMNATVGLAMLGGTVILLLVIGIRNAWDLVLWMAQQTKD